MLPFVGFHEFRKCDVSRLVTPPVVASRIFAAKVNIRCYTVVTKALKIKSLIDITTANLQLFNKNTAISTLRTPIM